jgi:hypothetical protein
LKKRTGDGKPWLFWIFKLIGFIGSVGFVEFIGFGYAGAHLGSAEVEKPRSDGPLTPFWHLALILGTFIRKQPKFFDLASVSKDFRDTEKDALVFQEKRTYTP